jgi:hypothetical protein
MLSHEACDGLLVGGAETHVHPALVLQLEKLAAGGPGNEETSIGKVMGTHLQGTIFSRASLFFFVVVVLLCFALILGLFGITSGRFSATARRRSGWAAACSAR